MAHVMRDQTGQGYVFEDPTAGICYGAGPNVPADNAVGFAPNCLWLKTNATGGVGIYINRGTRAAANFDAYLGGLDLSTLVTTVTELNLLSGLLATASEINAVAKLSTNIVTHGMSDPATLAITAALHHNKTIYVTKTDGLAITLPVPVAGMKFRIVLGATIASASTIKSVAGTHLMIGYALMGNDSDNTIVRWPAVAASTYDTIDLLGTSNSTGGLEGQVMDIQGLSTTRWFVEINGDAAGTEATPFSDTVT